MEEKSMFGGTVRLRGVDQPGVLESYPNAAAGWIALMLALLLFAGWPTVAGAQTSTTGVVLGTVSDQSGAVVVGAEVKLLDKATNQVRTQTSNEAGGYVFSAVAPGVYSLTVSTVGFRTAEVPELRVEVNKSYTMDFKLEVGDITSVITVESGVGAELQTTDAQVGNVLDEKMIRNLPTFARSTFELMFLNPGTTQGGFNTGGTVTGARSDQNTILVDGIDVTDNLTGGQGIAIAQTPIGVDAVDEFRITVANPNATFARSGGGQISLVSPRGANDFHGVGYWFHQNDNLNANTWTLNHTPRFNTSGALISPGTPKGELKDNRGGFSLGGPFWKDKTFFFSNYEVRRFSQLAPFTRTVPTAALRNGILTFRDGAGNPVQYDLLNSTLCGSTGTLACDPRGLGISPTVRQMYTSMPVGNDGSLGDGLNTTGFRGQVPVALTGDAVTFRLDHKFSEKLQFVGRYSYQRNLQPITSQLDFRDPLNVIPLRVLNLRGANVTAGFDYQFTPNLINSFRFGWVQNRTDAAGTSGRAVAALLGLPGTTSAFGGVGIDLVPMSEPIAVDAQNTRTQLLRDRNIQFVDNQTWLKGSHTVTFGGEFRLLPLLFIHNDLVISTTSPVAQLGTAGNLLIPSTNRPRTCSATVTTNCINVAETGVWNSLYAATLGMVDNVAATIGRDANLNTLPLTNELLDTDTNMRYYQFHFQDAWRIHSSLTVTYGVTYSWLTPPTEARDRMALLTDDTTGEVISARAYLRAREFAAQEGRVFNPQFRFVPLANSSRDNIFNTDYSNVGPRVSAAWNPSFQSGILGRLFGNRHTVVRGGFGIAYDRVNTVSVILSAGFGIPFGHALQRSAPFCNASATPGPGCNAAGANAGLRSFRVGVDGTVPTPTVTLANPSGLVPAPFSTTITFATDPDAKTGRNHLIDFTIQRELPANMLLEVGYLGRLGRNLPTNVDMTAAPFFFRDAASGQTFAQAFDNVACVLRGQGGQTIAGFACPATLQPQPWFDNQLPGLGTTFLASALSSFFETNNATTLFFVMNTIRPSLGLPAFNNTQILGTFMRTNRDRSNYHALFFTLRNRPWHGVQFDVNYTFSKSLDQIGLVQNNVAGQTSAFRPDIDYGPSLFDRRHVFNGIFQYELPFGPARRWSTGQNWLNRIIGGWYTSGIFRAQTGLPLVVFDGGGAFGGSLLGAIGLGAIPTVDPASLSASVNRGVAGSGGIGTTGDPARTPTPGTGLNVFADPQAAFNSFRRVLISVDGRSGRPNAFRGLGFWNLDFRLAKETQITERVRFEFSADFFNVFNNVNLFVPAGYSLANRAGFGVITDQFIPPNRTNGARWIQFGTRIVF
ncbi:MAG: carboxypeptidase-like regulatory domain-containing protein [Verrucomicrobiales bacterium]|nr:carboxypeptidase-like regulatory domain-containing protein [Verrucomicrobiales bacterium]